jgi:hypothetical protein
MGLRGVTLQTAGAAMRKFGLAVPIAGLAVSIGGVMVGGLSGQSAPFSPPGNVAAVELLSPEFDPPMPGTFQTPVVDLGAAVETPPANEAVRSDLPVIMPLPLNLATPPCEPAWRKCQPDPLIEASPTPHLAGSPERDPGGLPPLPSPRIPGPGHSQGRIPHMPRPGHTAPKRLSDSERGFRAW